MVRRGWVAALATAFGLVVGASLATDAGAETSESMAVDDLAGYRVPVESIATSSIDVELHVPELRADRRCDRRRTAVRSGVEVRGKDGDRAAIEITTTCRSGKVRTRLHLRPSGELATRVRESLAPGDLLVLRVLESDGINELSVTNVDADWTGFALGGDIRPVRAEIGVSAVGGRALPKTDPVRFAGAWIDGQPLTELDATRTRLSGEDGTRAKASRLDAGGAFDVRIIRR